MTKPDLILYVLSSDHIGEINLESFRLPKYISKPHLVFPTLPMKTSAPTCMILSCSCYAHLECVLMAIPDIASYSELIVAVALHN